MKGSSNPELHKIYIKNFPSKEKKKKGRGLVLNTTIYGKRTIPLETS